MNPGIGEPNEGTKIGRITPTGAITEFSLPNKPSYPEDIVAGPDGNVWFTDNVGYATNPNPVARIGKITPAGVISEFPMPQPSNPFPGSHSDVFLSAVAGGPDGNLWATEHIRYDQPGEPLGSLGDGWELVRISPK